MSNLLNVHFYDGKLNDILMSFRPEIERVSSIDKKESFDYIMAKILYPNEVSDIKEAKPTVSSSAVMCLKEIIGDYNKFGRTEKSENYDLSNDLYADDLLYLIYEKIIDESNKDKDYIKLLYLQLEEMTSGLCAQGRTTRLFQVLVISS